MYVKLFTSIYQGTLRGNSRGLLVFTNLLAHCDSHGITDVHPRAIAEEVGLSVDQVREALDELESPDPESRSPEEDGRRIVRIDEHRAWGWRVVNYGKYRAIKNEDERREQNRISQQRYREKHSKQPSAAVISGEQHKPKEKQKEREKNIEQPSAVVEMATPSRPPDCPTQELIDLYHSRLPMLPRVEVINDGRRRALSARWREVVTDPDIRKAENQRSAALEWFDWYFTHAGRSAFLTGKKGDWRADFDFLMTPSKFAKVVEGSYHKEHA